MSEMHAKGGGDKGREWVRLEVKQVCIASVDGFGRREVGANRGEVVAQSAATQRKKSKDFGAFRGR